MILLQFDITFVPQRAVKGQALVDFLADHPIPADSPLNDELYDEFIMSVDEQESPTWEFYFDGASSVKTLSPDETPTVRIGLGLNFVSPEGHTLRYSYCLSEPRTNNEAEYEALILGLEMAIQMSLTWVKIFGDSQLIINQVTGVYKVLKPELIPYHNKAMELLRLIPEVTLAKVPRSENGKADALAKLAKELADPTRNPVSIIVQYRQALCLRICVLPIRPLQCLLTTYRTPTQSTPYALAFGAEAVLPLEVEIPSLRVAVSYNLSEKDNARLRKRHFERLVRPRAFRVGELVLVLRRPVISHRRRGGKFEPVWEGPFAIEQVYDGGAYLLVDANGVHPMPVINGQYLKNSLRGHDDLSSTMRRCLEEYEVILSGDTPIRRRDVLYFCLVPISWCGFTTVASMRIVFVTRLSPTFYSRGAPSLLQLSLLLWKEITPLRPVLRVYLFQLCLGDVVLMSSSPFL
ncbi:hypothetical protein KFK09_020414 [Dendrobium nobile]|uniref:RNase H type-1 domain-containing protein n=1 Tax=Dendrobium nobile TaxID=94219 RepID=A0A8T3AN26_DENNO|nr:hypothetical protein KFK09_020414 [Dendrobium nobile]